ncbi:MAG: DUF5063 domain-containing protein [Bacteroidales bacterium]|jgi:hypothetical protein|nr:DUF5063 domain-containing protein [Bacteroidales bacterium]OPZ99077.1 MAG: hypothetical protein BWY72_00519 [Bacteroidetes bacterium ADurb.Bin416]
MPSPESSSPVYSKNTLEFIAVAKSYCDVLDTLDQMEKERLVEVMLRLLPLLYLKGSLLPSTELMGDGTVEAFATETHYGLLAEQMAHLLEADDAYVNVYHPDIALADGAVASSVSEGLADIWQVMYDVVEVFRQGYDEAMNDALYVCKEAFAGEWGATLLNVLRALHGIRYTESAPLTDEE